MSAEEGAPIARRVLIADDQRVFVDALTRLLEDEDDLRVMTTCQSIAELRALLRSSAPDLVLLDHRFDDGDGIEVVPDILRSWPQARVVLLTGYSSAYTVDAARAAGCSAVVPKTAPADELMKTMRSVLQDRAPGMSAKPSSRPLNAELSARELQVLGLLADGASTSVIATRLGIRQTTARNHVQSILRKLGVSSQLEAVIAGSRLGLVNPFGVPPDGNPPISE